MRRKVPQTIRPRKLYRWLTLHPQLEAAVAQMNPAQLSVLNGYLARLGSQSGIPALVHGLVLSEAARRFLAGKEKES